MSITSYLPRAVNDFELMLQKHISFIHHLQQGNKANQPNATLVANGNNLTANYLGLTFQATPRPVLVQGKLKCLEYAFFDVADPANPHPVFYFYLTETGRLAFDSQSENEICDYDNQYVHTKVFALLQQAVLESDLFSPRK